MTTPARSVVEPIQGEGGVAGGYTGNSSKGVTRPCVDEHQAVDW
ncbi:hypothetical protein V5H41_28610 [Salmonella enterica]